MLPHYAVQYYLSNMSSAGKHGKHISNDSHTAYAIAIGNITLL